MAQFRSTQSVAFFAYESVTVANSATSLTAATYSPSGRTHAQYALVTVETAAIRFTLDGTTPSNDADTPVGHLAAVGDVIELEGSNTIARFQAIRSTSTSGVLRVSYAR